MDLREIGWGYIEWYQLAKGKGRWWSRVNTMMKLRVLTPRN
jgi:hypothetical protein